MKVRHIIRWVIPIFVFFWFPFVFYMEILEYHPHADDPFTLMFGMLCAGYCIVRFILSVKHTKKRLAVIYGLAASCLFFCYWIYRIPFCTACEPIDREDLGFMLMPFADRFYGP